MSDEETAATNLRVGLALAHLDFLFSKEKSAQTDEVLWSLNFEDEDKDAAPPLRVQIRPSGEDVLIVCVASDTIPEGPVLRELLRLNGALGGAKVGINRENKLVAWSNVAASTFDAEQLKRTIGYVVTAASDTRSILQGSTAEEVLRMTLTMKGASEGKKREKVPGK